MGNPERKKSLDKPRSKGNTMIDFKEIWCKVFDRIFLPADVDLYLLAANKTINVLIRQEDSSLNYAYVTKNSRSQWLRGPRLGSAATRLLRLWVRIPPGHGCCLL
jgi:hypothetical protein